jgi:iron complex outermembrane receptor protein
MGICSAEVASWRDDFLYYTLNVVSYPAKFSLTAYTYISGFKKIKGRFMVFDQLKWFRAGKFCISAVAVLALYSSNSHAQEAQSLPITNHSTSGSHDDDHSIQVNDKALEDLLKVLEQETEIATKSKLNIDFVPGMVSVLHGKDLLARGIRTVYEALALIPGIELSMTNDGQYQVVVRGVGKTYSSGKVKFLLNGVSFNATLNATTTALVIPIDLVDRIEVIRGPGSAIYGEFASVGVVNVITNKKTSNVFSRYSNSDRYTLGGQYAGQLNGSVSLAANFAYEENKGGNVQAGEDILASSPDPNFQNISNSPGPVNDKEENKVFSLNLAYQQYQLTWQFGERAFGDYFGAANAIPEAAQNAQREISMHNVELSNKWELRDAWQSNLKLGWLRFDIESSALMLFPLGFITQTGEDFSDEGVLGAPNYKEDKYYAGVDVSYQGLDKHNILLGLDYSQTHQGDTYSERNYSVDDGGGLMRIANGSYTGSKNWMAEDLSRRVFAMYAQDQYSITNRWMLTAGLRWDDYDDIGSDITPRLAVVYQLSDKQTLKAQYAQSFRPPTFLEQYAKNNPVVSGNPGLRSEQLENIELGYVYNNGLTIGRATAFYYELNDLIAIDTDTRLYENVGDVHARGVELELVKQLGQMAKIDGNVSYARADDVSGNRIYGVAEFMGNLGLIYKIMTDLNFNAQYRYVGDRARQAEDSREYLQGFSLFDVTLSKANLFFDGVTLRAGVKNFFDETVVYPAFRVRTPDQAIRPAYAEDYPQTGREFVIQISWQF